MKAQDRAGYLRGSINLSLPFAPSCSFRSCSIPSAVRAATGRSSREPLKERCRCSITPNCSTVSRLPAATAMKIERVARLELLGFKGDEIAQVVHFSSQGLDSLRAGDESRIRISRASKRGARPHGRSLLRCQGGTDFSWGFWHWAWERTWFANHAALSALVEAFSSTGR